MGHASRGGVGNCNSDVALRTTVNRLTVGPLAGRYIAGMSFCGGEALGLWKGMQMTNGNMLAFHPGARNPEYAEYGGMFRVGQTENVNLIMWPQMLKDAGFTRVAVMSGKTVKWGGNHGMMVDVLSQMVDSGELEEVQEGRGGVIPTSLLSQDSGSVLRAPCFSATGHTWMCSYRSRANVWTR